jgi:hypothetical protein
MRNPTSQSWRRCTRLGSRATIPFYRRNKRTAYVALETFLALNGVRFPVSDADAVISTLQMAAGDVEDDMYIGWVRSNVASWGGSLKGAA